MRVKGRRPIRLEQGTFEVTVEPGETVAVGAGQSITWKYLHDTINREGVRVSSHANAWVRGELAGNVATVDAEFGFWIVEA